MSEARPRSLTDWLRGLPDDALAEVFRLRPDITVPAPGDFNVAVNRLSARISVTRALEGIDRFTLAVADAIRLSEAPRLDDIAALFPGAPPGAVRRAVDGLRARAMAWGGDDALHIAGAVAQELGPYPAGLGRPIGELIRRYDDGEAGVVLATLRLPRQPQPAAAAAIEAFFADADRLRTLVETRPAEERSVLDTLALGVNPIGQVREPLLLVPADDAPSPVRRLLAHGLLVAVDLDRVELPREVGRAIRGVRPLGDVSPEPPEPAGQRLDTAQVDRAGGGQAGAVLRLVTGLLEALAAEPPRQLKSGGLGVRDLRRIARGLEMTEAVTALLLEIAYDAELLAATDDADAVWAPTPAFDKWLTLEPAEAWRHLVTTWLAMPRLPSLVGQRDDVGHGINTLSFDVIRTSAGRLRRRILDGLAAMPPGLATTPDGLAAVLAWHAPRLAGLWQQRVVGEILGEAEVLGLTGRGALTSYARTLLAGGDAIAVAAHLPAPVDHVLVQADLTVVAPGPLEPELAREIALVADVESSGGATVFRVTEPSIRRALDAGRTADDVRTLFTERSRTPVPQALRYLIDDTARRHGSIRVGTASTYLRSDDESAVAAMAVDKGLSALRLRRIAPTVLLARAPLREVLQQLRERGYAPVPESAEGAVVLAEPELRRAPMPRRTAYAVHEPDLDDTAVAGIVARIRAGDAAIRRARDAGGAVPGVTTATTLGVLQSAVRAGEPVTISYVNADGESSVRMVEPVSVGGGYLHGYDHHRGQMRTFALHRIISVIPGGSYLG